MTVFQGKKIRVARAAKGLSQQELASAASVSRETVNRAENGANVPGAEALARIAKQLDIPIDSLFQDEEVTA